MHAFVKTFDMIAMTLFLVISK